MKSCQMCKILIDIVWWSVLLLTSGSLFAEDSLGEGVECLRKSASVHAADWAVFKRCFGSGQMICIAADQKRTWTSDIQFEIRDEDLWYLLTTVNSEPVGFRDVDRVEIIADGEVISNIAWSNRFRPGGCKIYVRKEDHDGIFAASSGDQIDLRREISPVFLRSRSEKSFTRNDRATILESYDNGQAVVVVTYAPENSRLRYVLSDEFDGRLIRLEQIGADSAIARVIEYEWQHVNGVVQPKSITLEEFAYGSKTPGFRTHILLIDNLVAGSTGREFLLSEATVCEGARVIDYRPGASDPVRSFSLQTNGAKTVSAEVNNMPVRQGDRLSPRPKSLVAKRASLITFVLWFNVFLIAVGGIVWAYRYRKKVR